MRYWYDTEFIEDGKTIDLISIGIVAEDGREYYAQSTEFNMDKASPWVKENVIMHLDPCPRVLTHPPYSLGTLYGAQVLHKQGRCIDPQRGIFLKCPWRTREELRDEILAFMDTGKYGWPELIGYYSAYDHVAFCQIFGTMMDLPEGFPMYTRDIKQWCDALGNPPLPRQGQDEHNALADAKHTYVMWKFLDAWAKTKQVGE